MRQAITIRERKDGKRIRLQAFIYAIPPGQLRPKRFRLNVPISVTSKSGAQRWAEQVRRDIEAGKPPPQSREGREQAAARREAPAGLATMTLRDAVAVYLADCAGRGEAASSVEAKRYKLRNAIEVVGDVALAEAGELEASRVRSTMRERGYAATTINTCMVVFSTMLRRLHKLRLRGPVTEAIEMVRERKTRSAKAYGDDVFEALVRAAADLGPEVLATVLVCGEAAVRVGELVGLEVRDVDLDRRTLRVERSVAPDGTVGPTKNGEERTLIMTPRLVDVLRPLVEGRSPATPVFLGRAGGRISRAGVEDRLHRVQKLIGVAPKGPHVLRHTAAVSALTGGADPVAVQKMLGHRSLATTIRTYLTDAGDGPRRASEAMSRARESAPETVTDLSRAPKTRPLLVTRTYEKRK